jgi:hypothetical protein
VEREPTGLCQTMLQMLKVGQHHRRMALCFTFDTEHLDGVIADIWQPL